MKPLPRRLLVLSLFAGLVLVLLWFQGLIFRTEHEPVKLPGPAAVAPGARTAKATARSVSGTEVLPGFVEAVDPAELAARVVATIQQVAAREGDDVEAGAVLVELDAQDARARLGQARAARDAAQSAAEQARLAFERAERLHARDALTRQDLEAAAAAHEVARAHERRAAETVLEAETALAWYRIEAPFAGRILARSGDPGQMAAPGRPVLTLYRPDRQRFVVAAPEGRAAALALGEHYRIEFDSAPARDARLARVLPAADPRTGTVDLHFEFTVLEGLRPGLIGRLRLPGGERSSLVVPASAVQRIGQLERVMLVRDRGAVPVSVRTGKTLGDAVEILSGLREGDEVLLP